MHKVYEEKCTFKITVLNFAPDGVVTVRLEAVKND